MRKLLTSAAAFGATLGASYLVGKAWRESRKVAEEEPPVELTQKPLPETHNLLIRFVGDTAPDTDTIAKLTSALGSTPCRTKLLDPPEVEGLYIVECDQVVDGLEEAVAAIPGVAETYWAKERS